MPDTDKELRLSTGTDLTIAIAGLGVVGAETARQLVHASDRLAARAGRCLRLVAVSARSDSDRGFDRTGIAFESDALALARRADVDVVIELIGGEGGIALALTEAALQAGKHVVTANKALIAHHGQRLAGLAEQAGVRLKFEAAVAGGIPALKVLREGLAGNDIRRVTGILNGTCNYILSEMTHTGRDFDDVLAEAQAKGYAEADPSFDIDGIDAAHKLSILAAMAFAEQIDFGALQVTGIRQVTDTDISYAGELGYVIKLLGHAQPQSPATVQPCLVAKTSQLAQIGGALNAVEFTAEPVQTVLCTGPGAGAGPTASAVLADVIDVAASRGGLPFGMRVGQLARATQKKDKHARRYYLRLMVMDETGVLSAVTSILRDQQISVESMLQKGQSDDKPVALVLTTHPTAPDQIKAACSSLTSASFVCGAVMALPIVDEA